MKSFFLLVGILTAVAVLGIVHSIMTERWKRGVFIVIVAGLVLVLLGIGLVMKMFRGGAL